MVADARLSEDINGPGRLQFDLGSIISRGDGRAMCDALWTRFYLLVEQLADRCARQNN
jgi:hypothetical protein